MSRQCTHVPTIISLVQALIYIMMYLDTILNIESAGYFIKITFHDFRPTIPINVMILQKCYFKCLNAENASIYLCSLMTVKTNNFLKPNLKDKLSYPKQRKCKQENPLSLLLAVSTVFFFDICCQIKASCLDLTHVVKRNKS